MRRLRNWEERKWRRTQRPRKETSQRKGQVTSEREGGEQGGRGAWALPTVHAANSRGLLFWEVGSRDHASEPAVLSQLHLTSSAAGDKCLPVSGPQDLHLQNGRWWWTVILAPLFRLPPSPYPPHPSLLSWGSVPRPPCQLAFCWAALTQRDRREGEVRMLLPWPLPNFCPWSGCGCVPP